MPAIETAPTAGNHIALIITLSLIAAVLMAVVLAALLQWRKKAHRDEARFGQGFAPVTPPQDLIDTIRSLRKVDDSQRLELQHVFHRTISGGDIYLFDVEDAGSDETSLRAADAVAVVSPALDLPRFTLIPRFEAGGRVTGTLTQLAEKALVWAAARAGLQEIVIEGDPEFAATFLLLTDQPSDASAFLTARRRTELLQMQDRYVIDAKRKTFTLSKSPTERPEDTVIDDRLFQVRQDAERILSWFRSREIRYA